MSNNIEVPSITIANVQSLCLAVDAISQNIAKLNETIERYIC